MKKLLFIFTLFIGILSPLQVFAVSKQGSHPNTELPVNIALQALKHIFQAKKAFQNKQPQQSVEQLNQVLLELKKPEMHPTLQQLAKRPNLPGEILQLIELMTL